MDRGGLGDPAFPVLPQFPSVHKDLRDPAARGALAFREVLGRLGHPVALGAHRAPVLPAAQEYLVIRADPLVPEGLQLVPVLPFYPADLQGHKAPAAPSALVHPHILSALFPQGIREGRGGLEAPEARVAPSYQAVPRDPAYPRGPASLSFRAGRATRELLEARHHTDYLPSTRSWTFSTGGK